MSLAGRFGSLLPISKVFSLLCSSELTRVLEDLWLLAFRDIMPLTNIL